jgi:hypothetical protein
LQQALEARSPELDRYLSMLKVGVSEDAVRHKLAMDGVTLQDAPVLPQRLQSAAPPLRPSLAGDAASAAAPTSAAETTSVRLPAPHSTAPAATLRQQLEARSPELDRFLTMLKVGIPEEAVRHKLAMEGVVLSAPPAAEQSEVQRPPCIGASRVGACFHCAAVGL